MIKYELKKGNILKNGHTMFMQDVVQDLNRGAFLERERSKWQTLPIDSVSGSDCEHKHIMWINSDIEWLCLDCRKMGKLK